MVPTTFLEEGKSKQSRGQTPWNNLQMSSSAMFLLCWSCISLKLLFFFYIFHIRFSTFLKEFYFFLILYPYLFLLILSFIKLKLLTSVYVFRINFLEYINYQVSASRKLNKAQGRCNSTFTLIFYLFLRGSLVKDLKN